MKVTMNMQEILATIQRNQQQIDLLTANNTQLVHFLLSQGMIQNLSELPGFNGNGFSGGISPEASKAPGGECDANTAHVERRSRPASG